MRSRIWPEWHSLCATGVYWMTLLWHRLMMIWRLGRPLSISGVLLRIPVRQIRVRWSQNISRERIRTGSRRWRWLESSRASVLCRAIGILIKTAKWLDVTIRTIRLAALRSCRPKSFHLLAIEGVSIYLAIHAPIACRIEPILPIIVIATDHSFNVSSIVPCSPAACLRFRIPMARWLGQTICVRRVETLTDKASLFCSTFQIP